MIYLPLSTAAMRRAAELRAQARQGGYPTAPDHALDNVTHLQRFVPAEDWRAVTP